MIHPAVRPEAEHLDVQHARPGVRQPEPGLAQTHGGVAEHGVPRLVRGGPDPDPNRVESRVSHSGNEFRRRRVEHREVRDR